MCDFKPGDEVVCVDDAQRDMGFMPMVGIRKGETYTIAGIGVWPGDDVSPTVFLVEVRNAANLEDLDCGYAPDRFRKVQRRDLSAWLKTSVGNTDKLDKRQTKKVRA